MDHSTTRATYERDGFVRLPAAFAAEEATAMAGAVRSSPRLADLRRADTFAGIASREVRDAITAVLGADWPEPNDWGGALFTEPTPGTWRVPTRGWHIDYPVRGAPLVELLLKWFAYLDVVAPGSGATVVLAGSHRLVADWAAHADPMDVGRSAAVRDAIFGLDPWFRSLDGAARVRGVDVRVVELTGHPGDVVLIHPHLLHAVAPNHGDRPRLMVTGGLEVIRRPVP